MPLLKPEIQAALQEAGLLNKSGTIEEALDSSGLTIEQTLEQLSMLAQVGGSEAIRLRAIEASFKLRGLLKDQVTPPPSITIVINDKGLGNVGVNPILIPREVALAN